MKHIIISKGSIYTNEYGRIGSIDINLTLCEYELVQYFRYIGLNIFILPEDETNIDNYIFKTDGIKSMMNRSLKDKIILASDGRWYYK